MRVTKAPEQRRSELIAAARELFEEKGIERTKVCDIVQRVGVAQGLFYYYFKSKEEVIAAVVEEVIGEVDRNSDQLINDPNKNFYEKLMEYIDLYLDNAARYTAGNSRDLRRLYHSVDRNRKLGDRMENLIIGNVRSIVDIGIQEGILAIRYPREMICMIVYGLKELSSQSFLEREKLLFMVEQALKLPEGSLTEAEG